MTKKCYEQFADVLLVMSEILDSRAYRIAYDSCVRNLSKYPNFDLIKFNRYLSNKVISNAKLSKN